MAAAKEISMDASGGHFHPTRMPREQKNGAKVSAANVFFFLSPLPFSSLLFALAVLSSLPLGGHAWLMPPLATIGKRQAGGYRN